MSQVPLAIRVDIRDIWEAKDQKLQVAVNELETVLGFRIEPVGQWAELYSVLRPNFQVDRQIVPSFEHIVIAWCRQLASRVERKIDPRWTEVLIKNLQEAGNGQSTVLLVRPSVSSSRICSEWDKDSRMFYLNLPKGTGIQMSSKTYDFGSDFDGFFPLPPPTLNISFPTSSSGPVRMPKVDDLPRPTDLLRALPVHYLIFYASFPARIQCSHEPTLVFLADYLTKHGRTNDNDSERRNMFKFETIASRFTSVKDLLSISSHVELRGVSVVNPTVVLAVVEGVLGYKRVEDINGAFVFRHGTGFA